MCECVCACVRVSVCVEVEVGASTHRFMLQTHIPSFVPAQFNSEVLLPLIPVRTVLQSELDVELAHASTNFLYLKESNK